MNIHQPMQYEVPSSSTTILNYYVIILISISKPRNPFLKASAIKGEDPSHLNTPLNIPY
jgi:hypothetical protein